MRSFIFVFVSVALALSSFAAPTLPNDAHSVKSLNAGRELPMGLERSVDEADNGWVAHRSTEEDLHGVDKLNGNVARPLWGKRGNLDPLNGGHGPIWTHRGVEEVEEPEAVCFNAVNCLNGVRNWA
ncbi:hypothetical protein R3P38DRAFT_3146162 [Favolaschia claudopus]|uniref:Uncharacterized protein n=1 Tax=Favolaschia claudopus TaxID=2862362 RepID=A0AAV9Z314_9AGAR